MLNFDRLRFIYFDKIVFSFFLNCFFVVLSYFIANRFNFLYSSFFIFKGFFLIISLIYLFSKRLKFDNRKLVYFLIFFFLSILFSSNPFESFIRAIPYIIGLIYVYNFVKYLTATYSQTNQLLAISICAFLIYSFPLIMAIININVLFAEGLNIYGKQSIADGVGFLSNNLGWSAAMSTASILTILSFFKVETKLKFVLISIFIFGLFILSISGSRSGILCLFITFLILVSKGGNFYLKGLLFFLLFGLFFFLSSNDLFDISSTRLFTGENSTLEVDKEKEYRVIALEWLINYYNENKGLWYTGIGFNRLGDLLESKVILSVGDFKVQGDMHNTYLQFLFENGIITFLAFILLFILPSLYNYAIYSRNIYFYIPSMVIPYFENNLNAGQFLFFPFVLCFMYFSNSKLNLNGRS
jgi:hypothetical protein